MITISLLELRLIDKALKEASRYMTECDPYGEKHDALLIDDAMATVSNLLKYH